MSKLIQVVKAVDRYKLIPDNLRNQGLTWFSEHDLWQYWAVFDDRTCMECERWQTVGEINGADVLSWFPYLEIYDQNMIYAHVHPNCRCYLMRVQP